MAEVDACAVRRALAADLTAVIALHVDEGNRLPGPLCERERLTWTRMMTSGDVTVYLAEVGAAVVGTATTMVMPNVTYDCAPTVFVEAVLVASGHRRRRGGNGDLGTDPRRRPRRWLQQGAVAVT